MEQNHLGKFLKLSSLNSPIVEYQLFNFGKESLKQIFLNSKCGEIINGKEFKDKPSNSDLVGTKNIYPLIYVYKKAKPKIKPENHIFHWKEDKIKKKINILSNAYMSLSILTLAEYYQKIIKDEKKRKEIVKFYVSSVKCQLNYYINNFRNELGLFVNKDVKEDKKQKKENNTIYFESTDNSFDFSSQAYLMIAFLKCSNMLKDTSPYKIPFLNFSCEIEKMFIDFKENILECKPKKLVELLNAFQLYIDVKPQISDEFLNLLFNIIEDFSQKNSISSIGTYDKISLYKTFSHLKSYLLNKQCNFNQANNLMSEYIWELEDFFSNPNFEMNEILNAQDLISYQIYLTQLDKQKSNNFYNDTLLPSKIFSCFPNIPKKYESEKYFQFEHKEQNIIPDKFFKPNSYKTMNETNLTPIICKNLHFSHDKNKFSKPKIKFDSLINMKLIFFILSNLKNTIIKTIM